MKLKKPKKISPRLSFKEREIKILSAAGLLFSQKGFRGTSTKAIAEKAGINEALLYRNFPTKDSLYTALLQQKISHVCGQLAVNLGLIRHLNLEKALFEISKQIISEHRKDSSLMRMMLFSALENHRLSKLFFQQRLPLIEFLEDFFNEKMNDKKTKKINAALYTRAFLSLINQYILVTNIFKAKQFFPLQENEMLKGYIQIFLKGISL